MTSLTAGNFCFSPSSSMPNSGTEKSLKRKRSSHHPQLPFDYPTPSPPESNEAIVKTEKLEQQQDWGSCQKPQQQSHNCLSRALTKKASSSFLPEISHSDSDPERENATSTSPHLRDQATQTDIELPVTESYLHWSGRGRSPFKTPAFAAIDGLKKGAKFIERLERETAKEKKELEKAIWPRILSLTQIKRKNLEVVQDRMDPMKEIQILARPEVDSFHGKSQSPDKYIAKMKASIPPVIYERYEVYNQALPEQMGTVLDLLEEDLGKYCIPEAYEAEILKSRPNGLRNLSRTAFSAMEARSEASIEKLWDKICEVVDNTAYNSTEFADENRWGTRVVQKALEWETSGSERKCMRPAFSMPENIQSQLLAKSCRQTYKGERFETKKTDWALSFSPQHPQVQREYEALASDNHPPALSQMENTATSRLVLYLGVEIKVAEGSKSTARAQLCTWFQTGVSRLRKLLKRVGRGTPSTESTLPLLGWTVIGERWELYMAIGKGNEETDEIIILGPFEQCECKTLSYFGASKLVQLIERVKDWARDVYWPWYCATVIEPLKLIKGQPITEEEEADVAEDLEERQALEGRED